MLISMNWISDFVDLTGLDKMALIRQFSLSTAEVENEIFHKGADLSGVVAAQIVSVENHPESHKLHLLKVDAGDGQLTDVVCGAPNVQLGMKTAFAKVGRAAGRHHHQPAQARRVHVLRHVLLGEGNRHQRRQFRHHGPPGGCSLRHGLEGALPH